MVAGFLGAEAPKRREKDRLGRGEGKEKLLRTVVPFLPHKSTYNLAIYRKANKKGLRGKAPKTRLHKWQFIPKLKIAVR